MDLLCDLGEDPALSGPLEMMILEVPTYRVHRLPRQTVSRCCVGQYAMDVLKAACAHCLVSVSPLLK